MNTSPTPPEPRTWPVVTVHFSTPGSLDAWDTITSMLMELYGCIGTEERDFRSCGFPVESRLTFQAEDDEKELGEAVAALLAEHLPDVPHRVETERVPEQDWVENWRKYYKRVPVTPTLYVGPPEEESELPDGTPAGVLYIRIEPGSAFGTGTHPTTQGILMLLEPMMRGGAPVRNVLDVGAGSGILSITAIRLGAKKAVGLEKDEVAEANFWLNAELNGVRDNLHYVSGATVDEVRKAMERDALPAPDIIFCNMISTDFDPLLLDLSKFGAPMLISGFLEEEDADVRKRLDETGWQVGTATWLNGWGTFGVTPK